MPKQEKKPYSIKRVVVNAGTPYEREMHELLGRRKFFGRRIRHYFKTAKAAEQKGNECVEEVVAHGQRATPMSDIERARAVEAIQLLAGRADLVKAVKFFLEYGPREQDLTVKVAAELFAASRGIPPEIYNRLKGIWRRKVLCGPKISSKYSDPHCTTLRRHLKAFEGRFCRESVRSLAAQTAAVRDYLGSFSNPRTLQNHRATLHSFFKWCIEQGHCSANPAARWSEQRKELRDYANAHIPGILTPQEFTKLLHAAQRYDSEMVGYLALGGLMALRPEEILKLPWEHVKDSFVYVHTDVSKTGDRAELPILPPLQRWLAVCRNRNGMVAPRDSSARRLALWRHIHDVDETVAPAEKQRCSHWPHDALRHSYGTYRYRMIGDIGKVCAEMRHEDPQVFRKHYVQRGVTTAEAEAYFAASPLTTEDLARAA